MTILTRKAKHSKKHSKNITKKQSNPSVNKHIILKSLAITTDDELKQLSLITGDTQIMQHIGKGNTWTLHDLQEFRQEEIKDNKTPHQIRNHYSYVLLETKNNKSSVIGFIEGRKNKSLFPRNNPPGLYDLLLRMFIGRTHGGRGYGKMIIKLFIDTYKELMAKDFKKLSKKARTKNNKIYLYSDIAPDNIASIKIHLNNNFLPNGTFKYPNKKIYNRYKYNLFQNF